MQPGRSRPSPYNMDLFCLSPKYLRNVKLKNCGLACFVKKISIMDQISLSITFTFLLNSIGKERERHRDRV